MQGNVCKEATKFGYGFDNPVFEERFQWQAV
jgi:hypothetical protein